MQNDNQANFKSWFVDVLEPLYRKREAGFVVLIVSSRIFNLMFDIPTFQRP